MDSPDPKSVQNVLRAARQQAPERPRRPLWGLKPAFVASAALLVAVGFFVTPWSTNKVAMEMVVTEAQLLNAEDQVVSVMYEGLSEDDLAFNFLMTYEDSYASL